MCLEVAMKDWTEDPWLENSNSDGFGDEFDWFDENPDDDPFTPKPSCPWCDGSGEKTNKDGDAYECPDCDGTGVQR